MDKNKPRILKLIAENKLSFVFYVLVVLTITFSVLYLFGLVPEEFKTTIGRYPDKESTNGEPGELPMSIKIPEVGVDTQVYNTESTSTEILDSYLLKGAVRYPGSGLLGGNGNILIFGHSTSFKIVQNQAFKTFVGLKNLKPGDLISVFSDKYEYIYKVDSVEMKEADKVIIEFKTNKNLLTLSTCNTSIGDKSARYVVEAEFVTKNLIQ